MSPAIRAAAGVAPDSDEHILRRIIAGDLGAFEALMRRYNRPLFRTARSILKDDAEAEDAVQEAYVLAYRSLHKFRGEANLRTWLTRIVINEAIARYRKLARRAEIIDVGSAADGCHALDGNRMDTGYETPDHAMLRQEMRRLLENKIDALPDAFRTVFMLRAIEEMSVEETAACLDIPEATVRTRYFRARGMLREALAREVDFAFEEAFSFDGARCDKLVGGTLARLEHSVPHDGGERR